MNKTKEKGALIEPVGGASIQYTLATGGADPSKVEHAPLSRELPVSERCLVKRKYQTFSYKVITGLSRLAVRIHGGFYVVKTSLLTGVNN